MNASFRPAIRKFICGPGQGNLADLDMCEDECNVPEEGELRVAIPCFTCPDVHEFGKLESAKTTCVRMSAMFLRKVSEDTMFDLSTCTQTYGTPEVRYA